MAHAKALKGATANLNLNDEVRIPNDEVLAYGHPPALYFGATGRVRQADHQFQKKPMKTKKSNLIQVNPTTNEFGVQSAECEMKKRPMKTKN